MRLIPEGSDVDDLDVCHTGTSVVRRAGWPHFPPLPDPPVATTDPRDLLSLSSLSSVSWFLSSIGFLRAGHPPNRRPLIRLAEAPRETPRESPVVARNWVRSLPCLVASPAINGLPDQRLRHFSVWLRSSHFRVLAPPRVPPEHRHRIVKERRESRGRVRRLRYRRPLPSELHVTVSRHAAQAFTNAPRGTRLLSSVLLARGSADDSWHATTPSCPPCPDRLRLRQIRWWMWQSSSAIRSG